MNLFSRINGIVGTYFQVGVNGPRIRNYSGILESRNANNDAYAVMRGADPSGNNDFVTKNWVTNNILPALVLSSIAGENLSANVGQAVLVGGSSGKVYKCTSANIATYGTNSVLGVVISDAITNASVNIQLGGSLTPTQCGWSGSPPATGKARANLTTGCLERVDSFSDGDAPVGDINGAGYVTIINGVIIGPTGGASGDLIDTYPGPTVAKIRNRTVVSTSPFNKQAYLWNANNSDWEPASVLPNVVTKTGNYSANDCDVILCSTLSGPFTVSLPNPASVLGFISVKKISSDLSVLTIAPYGTEKIDGQLNLQISLSNVSVQLISDGTNWWIV